MTGTAPSLLNTENTTGWKPWKAGVSGNPGGRPKTADFSAFCRRWLKRVNNKFGTNQEYIMDRLAKTRPEIILQYAHGKPIERLEITDPDGLVMRQQMVIELARAIVQQSQVQPVAIEAETTAVIIPELNQDSS